MANREQQMGGVGLHPPWPLFHARSLYTSANRVAPYVPQTQGAQTRGEPGTEWQVILTKP